MFNLLYNVIPVLLNEANRIVSRQDDASTSGILWVRIMLMNTRSTMHPGPNSYTLLIERTHIKCCNKITIVQKGVTSTLCLKNDPTLKRYSSKLYLILMLYRFKLHSQSFFETQSQCKMVNGKWLPIL